ncbi:TIGR03085 family metal-binding protein [Georgenia sunbinii]|uniref:TIGR03085 family metal-binding protein n=1 Tax=Georgenia sunbinii TaxID=3117728 RepID=UPI002F2611D4
MPPVPWSEAERHALAATFRQVGPDAPTLCEGWRSRDLLAHVELRERAPWRQGLDKLGKPRPGEEPRQSALAARAATPAGYAALVDTFEEAAGLRPVRLLKDRANLIEYVVHHEDLRRAADTPAPPRSLPAAMQEAIFEQLRGFATLALRRSPTGVVLVDTAGGRRLVARRGADSVAVAGTPLELALLVTGRSPHAQVELTGRPAEVAAFREFLAAS